MTSFRFLSFFLPLQYQIDFPFSNEITFISSSNITWKALFQKNISSSYAPSTTTSSTFQVKYPEYLWHRGRPFPITNLTFNLLYIAFILFVFSLKWFLIDCLKNPTIDNMILSLVSLTQVAHWHPFLHQYYHLTIPLFSL